MTRPKDESGRLMPQAHKRLDNAAKLEMAGVMALSADGRLNHLDLKRKLTIARKAIDHATDGDTPPRLDFQKGCRRAGQSRAGRRLERVSGGGAGSGGQSLT